MRVIEAERGRKIDILIIDLLIASQGEQRAAAEELGISQSTLSHWIKDLGLMARVREIRLQFDLPVSDLSRLEALTAQPPGDVIINNQIGGPCSSCEKGFLGLPLPRTFKRITHSPSLYYIEIRDGNGDRHWFPLKDSNPPPRDSSSNETLAF